MKGFLCVVSVVLAFFDVKSLYDKYEYYQAHSSYLQHTMVGLKPIARLTPVATSSIGKGETLLAVPPSEIITTFDSYPWLQYYSDQSPEMIASAILISYKLDNSSSISRSTYIHQFPSDIEPPGHWLEDDLKVWLGKFIEYPHLVRTKFPFYDKFKDIAMSITDNKSLGYEIRTYAWAQAVLRTHGLDITKKDWKVLRGQKVEPNDEKVKGYAFVPLFELFNQYLVPDRFHPQGEYPISFSENGFSLYAQREFSLGEETYVPYRGKNNHELFEDYGITVPFNRHSFMEITIPVYSDLCKNTDNGCVFRLGSLELCQNYLKYHKNDLEKYRRGVKSAIGKFKFALRHQRRRVKILEDRNLKQTFHLSISEKWTAYKVLALVDRAILQAHMKTLKLV